MTAWFLKLCLLVTLALTPFAFAQDRYLGELFMVGFNFCPRGSAEADGQVLSINSNQGWLHQF